MADINVTNKFELTAAAIVAICAIGSFIAGLILFVNYQFEHLFTGIACWSFTVFVLSAAYLYNSWMSDDYRDNKIAIIIVALSFGALVLSALIAKATEFGQEQTAVTLLVIA